jgi:hypothetical protein
MNFRITENSGKVYKSLILYEAFPRKSLNLLDAKSFPEFSVN